MAGPLVKWHMPDGTPVQFQDVRPEAKPTKPDDIDTSAALEIIGKAMAETPGHEGRHAAVAMLFDIPLVEARAGFPAEDGVTGYIKFGHDEQPLDRMRLAEHAVVILAGPIGEKAGAPAWPPRSDDGMASSYSDEKALAHIVDRLNLTEAQYNGLVEITRTITSHSGIKRVADRIATLTGCGLTLNGQMLKDMHEGAWHEIAEENRPRTPAEIDQAEQREQQRRWWSDYLDASIDYYEQQAAEKAPGPPP
jgi:hypothetical protein